MIIQDKLKPENILWLINDKNIYPINFLSINKSVNRLIISAQIKTIHQNFVVPFIYTYSLKAE